MGWNLDTRAAAAYLGYAAHTLECWRWERRGPLYLKLPSGAIRYDRDALDEWAKSGHWTKPYRHDLEGDDLSD
ncbi:helix-turn-helix domain-containing protein [Propioniciclava soli]|uniref:Helix-turn-helix domain-containing protein n=1 Tax=Propioniciclava soli TaxID=2775081 RepID=A0ABZ3C6P1_9ACTN